MRTSIKTSEVKFDISRKLPVGAVKNHILIQEESMAYHTIVQKQNGVKW